VLEPFRHLLAPGSRAGLQMDPTRGINRLVVSLLVGLGGFLIGRNFASPVAALWLVGCFGGLAAALLVLQSPFRAFLLFVLTLPFEATLAFEVGYTIRPGYLALVLLIFVFIAHSATQNASGSFGSPLNVCIYVYLGVSALSLIMTVLSPPPEIELFEGIGIRGVGFRGIIQLVFLIFSSLGYFFTIYFCSTERRLKTTLQIYVVTSLVASLYGLMQLIAVYQGFSFEGTYDDPTSFRPRATFQEPLNFGHYLLSVLPFLLTLRIYRSRVGASGSTIVGKGLFPIVVMAVALLVTVSRGAWIGFLVSLSVIVLAGRRGRMKVVWATALIAAGVLPFAFYFYSSWDTIWWLLSHRFSMDYLENEPRLRYVPFMLSLVQESPILGVGLGNYALHQVSRFSLTRIAGAHGVYWQTLVETGILGFLAFIWMIVAYYWLLLRGLRKARGTQWWPYILGYLASSTGLMAEYLFFGDRLNLYVWLFMGMAIATVRVVEREAERRR